jgi:hypothetical protein
MPKPVALLLLALSLALFVPATAGAALPKKKYKCFVFYAAGVPSYTGRYIKITSSTKYKWFNSKTTKSGKYKLSGNKIRFKSGPLKGKKGTRKAYGDGTTGINITFKTAAGPSDYYCSY